MTLGISIEKIRDAILRDIDSIEKKYQFHQSMVDSYKKEIEKLREVEKEAQQIGETLKARMK